MTIPKADPILTPAEYGASPAPQRPWPINLKRPNEYGIVRIYPTIQGEGGQTGIPMTIVRLQGCPVGCVFCDTPESWVLPNETEMKSSEEIVATVLPTRQHWALITGGEPAWYDLSLLTEALRKRNIKTSLETSGVYPITGAWDWITVSPKPRGLLPFNDRVLLLATELKWLVGKQDDIAALERFLGTYGGPRRGQTRVSIQPISTSAKATQLCLDTLVRHPEWRLSLQTHKLLEIA